MIDRPFFCREGVLKICNSPESAQMGFARSHEIDHSHPPVFFEDNHQVVLGGAALIVCTFLLFIALAAFLAHKPVGANPNVSAAVDLSASVSIILLSLGVRSWLKVDRRKSKLPNQDGQSTKLSLLILLLVLVVHGLTDYLSALHGLPANPVLTEICKLDTLYRALFIVSICITSPLAEEIVVRGFIYNAFRMRFGFFASSVFCSIIFAVLHFSLVMLIPLFLVSFLLTWLYQKTGRLTAPYTVHATVNGLTILLALLPFRHTG